MISSCDNRDDAISSLARIYKVESNSIREIIDHGWPDFVVWEDGYSPFETSGLLNYLMGEALSSKVQSPEVSTAAYYHRTRYDGAEEWFDDGIHDAGEGIIKILTSIKSLLSEADFHKALTCSLNNVRDRDQAIKYIGPYAFDILEDAIAANRPGMNYDVPEFLTGRFWDGNFRGEIIKIIESNLYPVIVKFKAIPTDQDSYITGLWHYLYRISQNMDNTPYTHTKPSGAVKREDILKIIRI